MQFEAIVALHRGCLQAVPAIPDGGLHADEFAAATEQADLPRPAPSAARIRYTLGRDAEVHAVQLHPGHVGEVRGDYRMQRI